MPSVAEVTAFASVSAGIALAGALAFKAALASAQGLGAIARKRRRALLGARFGALAAMVPAALVALVVGVPWGGGMFGPQGVSTFGSAIGAAIWLFVPVAALGVLGAILGIVAPGGSGEA